MRRYVGAMLLAALIISLTFHFGAGQISVLAVFVVVLSVYFGLRLTDRYASKTMTRRFIGGIFLPLLTFAAITAILGVVLIFADDQSVGDTAKNAASAVLASIPSFIFGSVGAIVFEPE